jgi:hypothetical protein
LSSQDHQKTRKEHAMQNTELARRVLASAAHDPEFDMSKWSRCLAAVTLREAGYTAADTGFLTPDGQDYVSGPDIGAEAGNLLGWTDADEQQLSFSRDFCLRREEALDQLRQRIEASE